MGMTHAGLTGSDWGGTVERLRGGAGLEQGARPSGVRCGVDLSRPVLTYCLGLMGLRLTAAWAEGIGLASLSNVALLGRLRNTVPWLESIVASLLSQSSAARSQPAAGAGGAAGGPRRGR